MLKEYQAFDELAGRMFERGPVSIDLRFATTAEGVWDDKSNGCLDYTLISVVGRPVPIVVKENYERVRRDLQSIRR